MNNHRFCQMLLKDTCKDVGQVKMSVTKSVGDWYHVHYNDTKKIVDVQACCKWAARVKALELRERNGE